MAGLLHDALWTQRTAVLTSATLPPQLPDRLGLPIDDIRLLEGDTDQIPFGNGTWGARSASVAGWTPSAATASSTCT